MTSFFKKIKQGIRYIVQRRGYYLYSRKVYGFHRPAFSQEGEDLVLARIFEDAPPGFFVDIGAHHPQRLSNTYYFYLRGWKGINIDAKPGSMRLFNKIRPRDINLEKAISNKKTALTYYEFNEPALNSFVEDLSKERENYRSYEITGTRKIQTHTLQEVLDEYLPKNQVINFLSIDVEGLEMDVLQSNNWDKYCPEVVLVEDLELKSLGKMNDSEVVTYLRSKGYELFGKTGYTLIFKNKNINV